jgi:ankyrin repeat protein
MSEEVINKWASNGYTALMIACKNEIKRITELIKKLIFVLYDDRIYRNF